MFDENDEVEITGPVNFREWIGMRARVMERSDDYGLTYIAPMTPRPDAYNLGPFYWDTENLKKAEEV